MRGSRHFCSNYAEDPRNLLIGDSLPGWSKEHNAGLEFTTMSTDTGISLRALAPPGAPVWLKFLAPMADHLLGLPAIDQVYDQVHGLPPFEFVEKGLDALEIRVESGPGEIKDRIPEEGPLLIVSNHPFGGVEMLALAQELKAVRTDIKFLANSGLQVFNELRPLLIAINPLKVTQKNLSPIRQCEEHLNKGSVLVIFPAGKVSFRPRGSERVQDRRWNRVIGHLAKRTGASLLPVFFSGENSPLFQTLGNVWDRSKLLLLPREFIRMRGKTIRFELGHAISENAWRHLDARSLTAYARLMTYLLEPRKLRVPGNTLVPAPQLALVALSDASIIEQELADLPAKQRLLDFKQFSVFYAQARQIPALMNDITRERERVFRLYDEGSGQARDGDDFDQTYVQLFVWDNENHSLVGAYRMGRTDLLRKDDPAGVYLTQMFEFDDQFYDNMPPALELGRSFVVPEHQKSFHSLYLLWRGIGRYLVTHPQYRRLYGTVSLSRQYDDRAIALMCAELIEPLKHVRPRHALEQLLHPEWLKYRKEQGKLDIKTLSACIRGLDAEGKDLPVLVRHYHKIGAKFHCVAVDPNFNNTPGLLLMVDMDNASKKAISTFLGKDGADYLAYANRKDVRAGSRA